MADNFLYKNDYLTVNGLNLETVCKTYGTPCYLYSADKIEQNLSRLRNALGDIEDKIQICFAVKANSNLTIIKFLADLRCGVDCVSMGEIQKALKVGIPSEKIVFSGVGKTKEELEFALKHQIMQINVESVEELQELSEIAKTLNIVAKVALRVNTKTDAKTHKYLSTGRQYDKFGISVDEVIDICSKFPNSEQSFVNFVGLSCHLGSQITNEEVFAEAFKIMISLTQLLKDRGLNITTLDLGGGLGIPYKNEDKTIDLNIYCQLIKNIHETFPGVKLILEPGRFLIADSGCILSQVIRIKKLPDKNFLILDAGMNDLIRPCLYQAYHKVVPLKQTSNSWNVLYDIVGPVCESADYFCVDTTLPELYAGDYVAILNTGAYGFTMASRYNSRPLPAEVLSYGQKFYLIGSRETVDDALVREKLLTITS